MRCDACNAEIDDPRMVFDMNFCNESCKEHYYAGLCICCDKEIREPYGIFSFCSKECYNKWQVASKL